MFYDFKSFEHKYNDAAVFKVIITKDNYNTVGWFHVDFPKSEFNTKFEHCNEFNREYYVGEWRVKKLKL
jgi:hypothetical protein